MGHAIRRCPNTWRPAATRRTGDAPAAKAVQRLIESPTRSNSLFSRNSGRKTVTHFSWNCSSDR
ncbi:MAG: hypothetical protein E5W21_11125 [Mesorhizobium sp.]|nr:MAG: hypothetical protein E5W21_11125 [Mesorhizobium sp.]